MKKIISTDILITILFMNVPQSTPFSIFNTSYQVLNRVTNPATEEYPMISMDEFSTIANDYAKSNYNKEKYDETVTALNKTLNKKEPKNGTWLFDEIDKEVLFLDQLALEQQDKTNRARGTFLWNEAIDNILQKYCSDVDIYSEEAVIKEYDALRIMDGISVTKTSQPKSSNNNVENNVENENIKNNAENSNTKNNLMQDNLKIDD